MRCLFFERLAPAERRGVERAVGGREECEVAAVRRDWAEDDESRRRLVGRVQRGRVLARRVPRREDAVVVVHRVAPLAVLGARFARPAASAARRRPRRDLCLPDGDVMCRHRCLERRALHHELLLGADGERFGVDAFARRRRRRRWRHRAHAAAPPPERLEVGAARVAGLQLEGRRAEDGRVRCRRLLCRGAVAAARDEEELLGRGEYGA